MKRLVILALGFNLCLFSYSQNKKSEYQDPAFWIDLESNKKNVPVKFTSFEGKSSYTGAPIKFIAKKDPNLKPMVIVIDSIKYEVESDTRQIVFLDGKVDLSCCRNMSINMEFYDEEENLIQFSRTDNDGVFKLKSINGNILEIKNEKIKINFKKLKTIDANWDVRYATLERNSVPEENNNEVLEKKEQKQTSLQSN